MLYEQPQDNLSQKHALTNKHIHGSIRLKFLFHQYRKMLPLRDEEGYPNLEPHLVQCVPL